MPWLSIPFIDQCRAKHESTGVVGAEAGQAYIINDANMNRINLPLLVPMLHYKL